MAAFLEAQSAFRRKMSSQDPFLDHSASTSMSKVDRRRRPHSHVRVRRHAWFRQAEGRFGDRPVRPRLARGAGAIQGGGEGRRPRGRRERTADFDRRDLRRAARRPQGGSAAAGTGSHRESSVRLRQPIDRVGRAVDPARRGEDGPRGRHGEHEPGAVRDVRRAHGLPLRQGPRAEGHAVREPLRSRRRSLHGADGGEDREAARRRARRSGRVRLA